MTKNRNSLELNGELMDRVANTGKEISNVIFAYGFGGITDLEVGPDGNLYVLVYDNQDGRIYRIH